MDRNQRDRLLRSYANELARSIRKEKRIAEIEAELEVLRDTESLPVPVESLDVAPAHVAREAVRMAREIYEHDDKHPDRDTKHKAATMTVAHNGRRSEVRVGGGTLHGMRRVPRSDVDAAAASRNYSYKPIDTERRPSLCDRCESRAPELCAPMPDSGDNGRKLIERQWVCGDCYRAAILDEN